MPTYIKQTTTVNIQTVGGPCFSGDNFTEEEIRDMFASLYPLYTGHGPHTPEHEEYTRLILNNLGSDEQHFDLISSGLTSESDRGSLDELDAYNTAINSGAYVYVENMQHHTSNDSISFDIVGYFRDEEHKTEVGNSFTSRSREQATRHGLEVSVTTCDFHKPYRDAT